MESVPVLNEPPFLVAFILSKRLAFFLTFSQIEKQPFNHILYFSAGFQI